MSSKYDRQMNIINCLAKGNRKVYAQLANDNCVSVKTIKKDINELSLYLPIITFVGKNGGVELSKGYVLKGFVMKSHYIELIVEGLIFLKTYKLDNEIDEILRLLS